jgi:hypothetical protein
MFRRSRRERRSWSTALTVKEGLDPIRAKKRSFVTVITLRNAGPLYGSIVGMDRVPGRAMEGPMLVSRTSLLVSATTAVFVVAASTGAEAGFLCKRGMGSFARFYNPPPTVRFSKAPHTKVLTTQRSAKAVQPKAPVENPTKSISTASAKPANFAGAKPASIASAKPTEVADTTESAPVTPPTERCLVKEYLDTGMVRFRDVCTKEWAINSVDNDAKSSKIRGACLTKQNSQNGVVMFKDVCTGEWAMNTAKQIALANAQ